jgi:hypothetical protein
MPANQVALFAGVGVILLGALVWAFRPPQPGGFEFTLNTPAIAVIALGIVLVLIGTMYSNTPSPPASEPARPTTSPTQSSNPAPTQPTPQAECIPAKTINTFKKPDIVTHGGDGRIFANLQNISVSVTELCTPPSNITYKYIIGYHFYSGNGAQKGTQSVTVTFLGENGAPLASDVFGLDLSRCIYDGGEDRTHEKELGAIAALIKDIAISVAPGGGKSAHVKRSGFVGVGFDRWTSR